MDWSHCTPVDLSAYDKPVAPTRLQSIAQPVTLVTKKGGSKSSVTLEKDVAFTPKAKPKNLKFKVKNEADKKSKHSEKSIQKALNWYFDWQANECYTGITFGGGIADFIRITKARYVAEVEIKISLSDWNADQHKDKWLSKERKKVCQFYYAVPSHLIPKLPKWVPDTVGLLEVCESGFVTEIRPAARTSKYRLKVSDYVSLHRALYFRYMDLKTKI